MPESNKAQKRRIQKANREAGIGDEKGRLIRVKDPPKMGQCTVCQAELIITKTNTELKMHSESKHGKTLDDCFPTAAKISAELVAAVSGKGGGAARDGGRAGGAGGMTKAERKKKEAAGLDDLLSAGLSAGKKGKGKK